MDGMYSTALALRAIIAVFLERTVGRFVVIAGLIALLILVLAAYNAANGLPLLWILVGLIGALLVGLLLIGAIVFFTVLKLLPRKLKRDEKRKVVKFTKTLWERLEMARTPIPLLLIQLTFQSLIDHRRGSARNVIERAIDESHSLNHDFRTIRGFFEPK